MSLTQSNQYKVGCSRLEFDGIFKGSDEYAELLLPLLIACPSFILPACARIFRVYEMQLTNTADIDRITPSYLQTRFRDAGLPAHLYAKEFTISVGVLDICNGAVLKELSCEPYIDRKFPKVRSIKFMLSLPTENLLASLDAKSNISGFVRRIKQMAPMLRKISISLGFRRFDSPWFPVQQFNNLVAQLSRHAVDIVYHFKLQPVIIDQQLNGLCSLMYSSLNSTSGGKQIMQLARRN
ncbi:hypothetical protein GGI19_006496 [Coemansia pectinata]|uniref:Uncharacterized protein n=1 Tax=Coemansia pectinata TaxID=1052879 RepID=A0A9W8L855_9FUNG|nr:hypothetical protein GGI19_006496 [Coemansia pectinata]